MDIVAAGTIDLGQVRQLFEEYWASFGFSPCFQDFATELGRLPGAYAPPDGRLGLAVVEGEVAGCVALRRLDDVRCEVKRLYVRPRHRGRGLGLQLLEWVIAEARRVGYGEMYGDTMPTMERALSLYFKRGFEHCDPYLAEPSPGAVCLRLRL